MTAKSKKLITGAVGLALAAAIGFAGTLAYITDETVTKTNTITLASEGIRAEMIEPDWDGIIGYEYLDGTGKAVPVYDYRDGLPVYGYVDGDYSHPVTNANDLAGNVTKPVFDSTDPSRKWEYGEETAETMIPGSYAGKNPTIVNTGTQIDIWVAAKITLVYGKNASNAGQAMSAGDAQKVWDIIELGQSENWISKSEIQPASGVSSSQEFYYTQLLSCGQKTSPLFDGVSIRVDTTNAQIAELQQMGGFSLYVQGFAVQKEAAASFDDFLKWGITENGVVFA